MKNKNKAIKNIRKTLSPYKQYFKHLKCYFVTRLKNKDVDPPEFMVNEPKKIVYLVNSKCACSSIKLSLFTKEIKVSNNYDDIHLQSYKDGSSKRSLTIKEEKYFKFTFVRNPFERLVSFYINKFNNKNYALEQIHETVRKKFLTVEDFDDLINNIINVPLIMADRHFKPQAYLIDSVHINMDFIGRLENFQDDYVKLQAQFDLPELTHQNKSPSYNYMDYYSLESLEKVAQYYKEDIQRFNYSHTYDEIKNYLLEKA